jgi:hypothetical protein
MPTWLLTYGYVRSTCNYNFLLHIQRSKREQKMKLCGLSWSAIGYLPNKNTEWPINFILYGHVELSDIIRSFHLKNSPVQKACKKKNTKHLWFQVLVPQVMVPSLYTRHAKKLRQQGPRNFQLHVSLGLLTKSMIGHDWSCRKWSANKSV